MSKVYWIVFSKDLLWFTDQGELPEDSELLASLSSKENVRRMENAGGQSFLGVQLAPECLPKNWKLVHLRQAFELLSANEYKVVCKLKELLHWDEEHQFCGKCAHKLKQLTDISKQCPNCGREYWPSPSPAMIVLVEKPSEDGVKDHDEVLMIRTHTFPGSFHSLVAGYVESSETLEETVKREVLEETGISIKNIRYVASQSWPFPFVQMIGFRAEYADGTLQLQEEEIERGGWFRRKDLPELPGEISLARKLIDQWLREGE